MPVGAITAAVGVYAANKQAKATKKSANTIAGATDAATEENRRQFDVAQANQAPWLQTGRTALDKINNLLAGDYSGFNTSPDYIVARDEGLKGLDRSLAARGALGSGGADADRITFASNLGTQQLGNYRNWLSGIAGVGQTTAQNLANLGADSANQIGRNLLTGADARASAYQQNADTSTQLAGVLGGQANNWLQGGGWQKAKGMFGPGTI
ncbi:hypothetical protein ACHZ97_14600 [Lysobacter soli]|uniref:hypothetical protein n=1 Tax=Lysobacter soli TaxID=453783 RepID=UPI0037C8DF2E